MDDLPEWIVQDVSPGEDPDYRVADLRFFAEDGEHAKRQWFELMGLPEDDESVALKVIPLSEYFAFRAVLGDALRKT